MNTEQFKKLLQQRLYPTMEVDAHPQRSAAADMLQGELQSEVIPPPPYAASMTPDSEMEKVLLARAQAMGKAGGDYREPASTPLVPAGWHPPMSLPPEREFPQVTRPKSTPGISTNVRNDRSVVANDKNEQANESGSQSKLSLVTDPTEYGQARERAREFYAPHRADLASLKNRITGYLDKLDKPMDLDPMATYALTDAVTGSGMAATREKKLSPDDRAKLAIQLQEGLGKANLGLTKEEADYIKDQFLSTYAEKLGVKGLAGTTTVTKDSQGTTVTAADPNVVAAKRAGARGPNENVQAWKRGFESTNKDDIQTYKGTASLISQLNSGVNNWVSDNALKGDIIKSQRLYPVSDRDARMNGGSQAIEETLSRTLTKWEKGDTLTPGDRQNIKAFAVTQAVITADRLQAAKDSYIAGIPAPSGYNGRAILDSVVPRYKAPPKQESLEEFMKKRDAQRAAAKKGK